MLNVLCACFILSSGFSSVYILCQFHPEWWSVPEGGVFAGFVLAIIGIAGCFLGVVILSCLLLLMERVRSFCTEFCNTLIEQSLIILGKPPALPGRHSEFDICGNGCHSVYWLAKAGHIGGYP